MHPARALLFSFCLMFFALLVACDVSDTGEKNPDRDKNRDTPAKSSGFSVEESARNHPSSPPPDELPVLFKRDIVGVADRECVEVGNDDIVRSGQFVAGNFRPFVRAWPNPERGKIWWAPLHQSEMDVVKIQAILSGKPDATRAFSSSMIGSNSSGSFYPSVIELPNEGVWRLVATSGPDWGCFDLALTANRDS